MKKSMPDTDQQANPLPNSGQQAHQKTASGAPGLTLDRAVAMIAAHLGIVDEEQINGMSFVFFEDVLAELGHKLRHDAVVNAQATGSVKRAGT